MATLLEILDKSTEFLKTKGIEDARFEAETLLAFGLEIQRLEIYLQFDRPVSESETVKLRELIVKRGKRIPLQHIIGQVGFRHLELKTDTRALIPRPDTECIVDEANEVLKSKLSSKEKLKILEIGTGTGAIILSIAHEWKNVECVAIDVSEAALALAKENAELNNLTDVKWILSDLFEKVEGHFDLIISNPPYIPSKDIETLEIEVKQYDPILALDGGKDGFDIVHKILDQGAKYLNPNGFIILEVGYDQCDQLPNLKRADDLEWLRHGKDLAGIQRFGIWQKK